MTHAADLPFRSRRAPVLSSTGMVATSQPLAAQAGVEILRAGGNAADAAVATAAALTVVEPAATGVGGDCFALVFDAASRRVFAMNGSGRAPAALSIPALAERGISDVMPLRSPHAVTVPGAVAGWADTLARHGRMPLADVLRPAIHLAERGFPVSPLIAAYWAELTPALIDQPNFHELLLDGRPPRAGETWRNPGLATVLQEIADGGVDAFYRGRIAEAIVAVLADAGGLMRPEDLAAHHSTFEPPIATEYRGHRVYECRPNGQGITTLIALNLLEGFDLAALDPVSPEHLHYLIEAMRLAFEDARAYVADPAIAEVPIDRLRAKSYADERRALIDPEHAATSAAAGEPVRGSDTVYLAVVDGEGNGCSFINSVYQGFGTGIVPRGLGFSLHNRGANFSLDPSHPNALAGLKRPYHTIIPALSTYPDGSLHAVFGVKGAFTQPQGQVQVFVQMVDHGLDPQAALDVPRFCLRPASASGEVHLETGIPIGTMRELERRGHMVVPSTDRFVFGTGQAIRRDAGTGAFWGGTDPRADGAAIPALA